MKPLFIKLLNYLKKKSYLNEPGYFLPISLLLFSMTFLLAMSAFVSLNQEKLYHTQQMNWHTNEYLVQIGTYRIIHTYASAPITQVSGLWDDYENGTIKYTVKKTGTLLEASLQAKSGEFTRFIGFTFSLQTNKMIRWVEKIVE